MSGLSTNIFAALQKKKSIKKPTFKEDVKEEPKVDKHAEIEKAIFSGTSTAISNWADDSEDEWDAPAQVPAAEDGWNQATKGLSSSRSQARMAEIQGEDRDDSEESDMGDYHEDIHLDIEAELGIELPRSDDEDEEEESEEGEEELLGAAEETAAAKPAAPVQLSKKEKEELKKKELEDLDAVLAELGLESTPKEDSTAAAPSGKAAKRKAKKKAGSDAPAAAAAATPEPAPEATNGTSEETPSGPAVDPDAIKAAKAALAKKKASSKKSSAAAEAAAAAAAAKAKAKKAAGKDKSKYNEMPTR